MLNVFFRYQFSGLRTSESHTEKTRGLGDLTLSDDLGNRTEFLVEVLRKIVRDKNAPWRESLGYEFDASLIRSAFTGKSKEHLADAHHLLLSSTVRHRHSPTMRTENQSTVSGL